jgi:hypothetical protein
MNEQSRRQGREILEVLTREGQIGLLRQPVVRNLPFHFFVGVASSQRFSHSLT